MSLITYQDALNMLMSFTGGTSYARANADIKQAVRSALAHLYRERSWTYYAQTYSFPTVESMTSGSIAYTHAGGRVVTLTGNVFPSWSERGSILSEGLFGDIDRWTTTSAVMDENVNFGQAIASGSTFELFQDHFLLPENFQNVNLSLRGSDGVILRYIPPEEFVYLKTFSQTTGDPSAYTIMSDTEQLGRYAIYLYPAPSSVTTYYLKYQRSYRELKLTGDETASSQGTVTLASGSKFVTGTSTAFASALHKGSVLRVSTTTTAPTAITGTNPFADQWQIANVAAASGSEALLLRGNAGQTYTAVAYVITDPIDIPPDLEDAFLKRCRLELCLSRSDTKKQDIASAQMAYEEAYKNAAAADSKSRERRVTGGSWRPAGLQDLALLDEDA